MKKKVMKKALAAALSLTMISAMLAGCGDKSGGESANASGTGSVSQAESAGGQESSSSGQESQETPGDEIVRLQVLCMPSNTSGVITGWFPDYIKEQLGVELELLPAGDQGEQKLQALMTSGELPDIVVFKDDKQVVNAVAGDMLVSYDDYKDLLPNVYENAPMSLKYYAENMSNGQNKPYAVGVELKNAVQTSANSGGFMLRYDYYKEMGSPEVKTVEDFMPILEQMQEAHPTTENGDKVYAISLFSDWDKSYMTMGMFFAPFTGRQIRNEQCLAEIDFTNNEEIYSILDEKSAYMRFLNFMFEANQKGLVDPDSMTQRFSDYTQKATDGKILFGLGDWGMNFTAEQQNAGQGFRQVVMTDEKFLVDSKDEIGKGWSVAVGAASENKEMAFKVINLMYDYETAMVERNGPKGVNWTTDENGKPYVTEEGYANWFNPAAQASQDKGEHMFRAYASYSLNKEGYPIDYVYWEKPDYAPAETTLVEQWKEDYGFENPLELQYSLGNVIVKPFVPAPTMTDEMELISSRVGSEIQTTSWKMIFAKDRAEFDSLYAGLVEKAEGMGITSWVDWFRDEYNKNAEFGAQYVTK